MTAVAKGTEAGNVATSEAKVRCLLVPLNKITLIVPNAAVAEVTGYEEPLPTPHAPRWLLGMMLWRGRTIPLISFERMVGHEAHDSHSRVVVLNTLSGRPELPFVGVSTLGIPRLAQITGDMVSEAARDQSTAVVACRVEVDGETAVIPDVDIIEKMLLHLGLRVG